MAFATAYHTRLGVPLTDLSKEDRLGLLADLPGTWVGSGFTLISLPDFDSKPPSDGPKPFRLKLNATIETLQSTPIGGDVPNRGSLTGLGSTTGQPDINLQGLTYLQRVSDAITKEALHIEPGIWVNVPETVVPAAQASVVRLGTIPHADALLAQGTAFNVAGGPKINVVDSTPTFNPPQPNPIPPEYFDPFKNPPLPPGIDLASVKNPNHVLEAAILGQEITNTVVLEISTDPDGGIKNIPFVVKNANATSLDAIFWIETVKQKDDSTFLQLQYTQTVILNFLGIDWPHISVATLIKQ